MQVLNITSVYLHGLDYLDTDNVFHTASENVSLQPGCLDTIMDVSAGDMRKAVTYLQTCHQLSDGNAICLEDVEDISGKVFFKIVEYHILCHLTCKHISVDPS